MSEKTSPVHAEDPSVANISNGAVGSGYPVKRSFGTKVKRHCARFWWVHVIIAIILVLVITLPVVYVAYPNIAQHDVNKSTLNITSMSILDPTPESFDLVTTTVLHNPSSYHPDLKPWNGSLHLEDDDTAFAYLDVPDVKAHKAATTNIHQTLKISNRDAFTEYCKAVLNEESYIMRLKGRGGLQEGKLPTTHVNYNKPIYLKGLNGLKGFNVTSFNVLTTSLPDGSNANGTVYVPNPSVMTIDMGNLTLKLSVLGTPIGLAKMNDVVLRPGDNHFTLTATNDLAALTPIITKAPYNTTGIIPLGIQGNSSMYNGVELPYYRDALLSANLTVMLNAGEAIQKAGLAKLLGLNFGGNGTDSS